MRRPYSSEILRRVLPPITVWAVTQLLAAPAVARSVGHVDRQIEARRKRAEKALTRVRRNAASNPLLLAAGMVAMVAGIGMIVKAAAQPKR